MKNSNDNETFISIGLAAALILNKLKNASRLSEREDEPDSKNNNEDAEKQPTQGHQDEEPRRALA